MYLKLGDHNSDVLALQNLLKMKGFNPGAVDGSFGTGTEAAVQAFQRSEGLVADGLAGDLTLTALGIISPSRCPSPSLSPPVVADPAALMTVQTVSRMLHAAPIDNIKNYLPPIMAALKEFSILDAGMFVMANATIAAESAGYAPIQEGISRYNTSPGGHAYDLYDFRKDLGNTAVGDGALTCGRGFVQLTGWNNYKAAAVAVEPRLVLHPSVENEAIVAARTLAWFLHRAEKPIRMAIEADDLAAAREEVNGGRHGLDAFTAAYRIGESIFAAAGGLVLP